jgi:hypothetical protein
MDKINKGNTQFHFVPLPLLDEDLFIYQRNY